MARKLRDEKLDTRTARLKLLARAKPYFRAIQEGRAIGYRRIAGKSGTWVAQHHDASAPDRKDGRTQRKLGSADDHADADGVETLNFSQAQDVAAAWFAEILAGGGTKPAAPVTVADAMATYLDDYAARGGKDAKRVQQVSRAHILPAFGGRLAGDLKTRDITSWLNRLAAAPALLRAGKHTTERKVRVAETADARRARRATANRVLTVLKAALNAAWKRGDVVSDEAWRRVKPFPKVDAPRIRWLEDKEAVRLANACPIDFRAIVRAALLTGADWSELAGTTVNNLHLDTKSLTVTGKRGERFIRLSPEAKSHFALSTVGKAGNEPIFARDDGLAWGDGHQLRLMRNACHAASIVPAVGFHILRHTYATRMLRRGMAMHLVSTQLGHKSIKTTQKHYAHVVGDDVAKAVAEYSGSYGFNDGGDTVVMIAAG